MAEQSWWLAPSRLLAPLLDRPAGVKAITFLNSLVKVCYLATEVDDADLKESTQVNPLHKLRWISLLTGPDNTSDYTTAAMQRDDGSMMYMRDFKEDSVLRTAIATVLLPDAVGPREQAREIYAERSGRCSNCNRPLTVPTSLHRGLGPDCAAKLGLTGDDEDEGEEEPRDEMYPGHDRYTGSDYRDAGDWEPPF